MHCLFLFLSRPCCVPSSCLWGFLCGPVLLVVRVPQLWGELPWVGALVLPYLHLLSFLPSVPVLLSFPLWFPCVLCLFLCLLVPQHFLLGPWHTSGSRFRGLAWGGIFVASSSRVGRFPRLHSELSELIFLCCFLLTVCHRSFSACYLLPLGASLRFSPNTLRS